MIPITDFEKILWERRWNRAAAWFHRLHPHVAAKLSHMLVEMKANASDEVVQGHLTEICLAALEELPKMIATGCHPAISEVLETVKSIELDPAIVERVQRPDWGDRYLRKK